MRTPFALLLMAALVFGSGPARAAKVIFVSSEAPARVQTEERTKEAAVREQKSEKESVQEAEKRERLLKQLRDLYKQNHPEN